MTQGIGIKSFKSNGNNPFHCYKNLSKAINYVEKEKKPTFIEFYTYRQIEHCGPNNDDYLNYRSQKEINLWKLNDPLLIAEKSLPEKYKNLLKKEEKRLLLKITKAFEFAKNSPAPDKKSIFEDIYA